MLTKICYAWWQLRFWLADLLIGKRDGVDDSLVERDVECAEVRAFMEKFGMPTRRSPGFCSDAQLNDRVLLIWEELRELMGAFGVGLEFDLEKNTWVVRRVSQAKDLPGAADALIDLVYVVKGTAVALGLPWGALWEDVHQANMAKERGTKPGRALGAGDVIKPPGWVGPQTEDILEKHGWVGPQIEDILEKHGWGDRP